MITTAIVVLVVCSVCRLAARHSVPVDWVKHHSVTSFASIFVSAYSFCSDYHD